MPIFLNSLNCVISAASPTKSVKFAIASSLQTSSPIAYAKRGSSKPLDSFTQPPKIVTSYVGRDPVQITATATTTPLSVRETISNQSTGALDSNYLNNYGISDVANRQISSSFSTTTPGSDFDASSAESSHILQDYDVGTNNEDSRVSIEIKRPESKSESSICDMISDSRSPATLSVDEDASQSEAEDEVTDLVVVDTGREKLDESSRQSCRLTLEIDMRFQEDEVCSRLSLVARPSTVQSSEYDTSEPIHDVSDGRSPTPIGNSGTVLSKSDEDSDSPEENERSLQPYENLKASSEAIDIRVDDTGREGSLQDSIASKSASSKHTLKEESEPEFHEAPQLPLTQEESGNCLSGVPSDSGHSLASSAHALSSKQSSKESSFYRQSIMKGDASTMITGNMFSESVSTLGLTFSLPSHTQFSETSSSHNLSSQVRDETRGDTLQPLNIDHMFESSEHHLMTSSWLEDVNIVQRSTPSSFPSTPRADKEGFLSSQSSCIEIEKGKVDGGIKIKYRSSQSVSSSGKVSPIAKESDDYVEGVSGGVDDSGEVLDYGGDRGGEEGGGGGGGDSDRDETHDTTDSSSSAGSLSVDDEIDRINEKDIVAELPHDGEPFDKEQVERSPGGESVQDDSWNMDRTMDNMLEGKKDTPRQTLAVSFLLKHVSFTFY